MTPTTLYAVEFSRFSGLFQGGAPVRCEWSEKRQAWVEDENDDLSFVVNKIGLDVEVDGLVLFSSISHEEAVIFAVGVKAALCIVSSLGEDTNSSKRDTADNK